MAYILNGTTLPSPKAFKKTPFNQEATLITLNNTHKKDITGRKYQYTLNFEKITKTEMDTILGIYSLEEEVEFQSTETNLPIAETLVHVDVMDQEYGMLGNEYRANVVLVLTEVQ